MRMSSYRLNLQIGDMMQHLLFSSEDAAIQTLLAIFQAKAQGKNILTTTFPHAVLDVSAIVFADVRKQ